MSMPATGEWEVRPRARVRPGNREVVGYVSLRTGPDAPHHAVGVVDLAPDSPVAGRLVWQVPLPAGRTPGLAPLAGKGTARLALEHDGAARLVTLDTGVMHRPRLVSVLGAESGGWHASRAQILTLSHQAAPPHDPLQQLAALLAPRLQVLGRGGDEPGRALGFGAMAVAAADLSAPIWAWTMPQGSTRWQSVPILSIPAEPASRALLPPLLHRWGAVPPIVSDLRLSADRQTLLVACWGTGALLRYDVTRLEAPRLLARLDIGGIANRAEHPRCPGLRLDGGPQRIELSADGRRVYVTNGLGHPGSDQFYPGGVRGWIARADLGDDGSMHWDRKFLLRLPDGILPDQLWLKRADE